MGSNWHGVCKLKRDYLLLGPFLLPNFWRHTCRCLLVLTIACALGRLTAPWQVGFTGHRTNQCHHPNSKVQTFHSVEYNKTCYLSPDYLYGWFPLDCLGFQHHAPVILQEYQHIPHVPLFFPHPLKTMCEFPYGGFLGSRAVTWKNIYGFRWKKSKAHCQIPSFQKSCNQMTYPIPLILLGFIHISSINLPWKRCPELG